MIPVCTETMRELSPALLVPDRLSGPHLRPRSVPSSPCRRHAAHRVHTDGEPAAFALYGLGSEHAQTETVSPPQWPRPSARLLPLPLTTEGLAKICTQLLTIFLSTNFNLLGSHLVEKCRRSGTLGSSTCTQHSLVPEEQKLRGKAHTRSGAGSQTPAGFRYPHEPVPKRTTSSLPRRTLGSPPSAAHVAEADMGRGFMSSPSLSSPVLGSGSPARRTPLAITGNPCDRDHSSVC